MNRKIPARSRIGEVRAAVAQSLLGFSPALDWPCRQLTSLAL